MQALAEVEDAPLRFRVANLALVLLKREQDLAWWKERRRLLISRMVNERARPLWKPTGRQVLMARIDALRVLDSLIADLSS
jgi:hypothetical protein